MNTYSQFSKKNLYTIPASVSFSDTLAKGLLDEVGEKRKKLASYLILLPTRRACRNLREAFLRQTNGQPLLLPRLQAFGDVDAEELQIMGQGALEIDIPPAMSSMKRQILLAQAISKLPEFTKGPEQNMALASALGQLMDEIHTENLSLADLPNIVDRDAFSEHWQITVDFLDILSEHWPKILKEHGAIDASDRRNRLINSLNALWQTSPPKFPIIAAGSTGSIPATANLLKTISQLPEGSVILPALDLNMSDNAWNNIEEGHPQTTLKLLLSHLDCERHEVKIWPYVSDYSAFAKMRETIISDVMTPPETTNEWQDNFADAEKKQLQITSLQDIHRYDCDTPQEEALLISLLLRESLETPSKVAALVTSDRALARRVSMACHRWNINIDDSAGLSLHETSIGMFLRTLAQCAIDNIKPLSFLTLLKHEKTKGAGFKNFRKNVRTIDHKLLRGIYTGSGFNGLYQQIERYNDNPRNKDPFPFETTELIEHLNTIISPLLALLSDGHHDFSTLLKTHIDVAEKLNHADQNTEEIDLWKNEEGKIAANFLSNLFEQSHLIPAVNGSDYLAILTRLMKSIMVRPPYGTHPRLMILGQLEARLIQADRVILAGLNEGVWPPDSGHDPWMSRPMRQKFGLPIPERSITLSAHDFVQGFCSKEVFLTRSQRVDGTPTVPARWLQRLDTYLETIDIDPDILYQGDHKKYLKFIDHNKTTTQIERPAPTPSTESRPTQLSVTKIETWLKDPYQIYAKEILKLNKLDPIEKEIGAADRGSVLHDVMDIFTKKYPKEVPNDAKDDFINISKDVLTNLNDDLAQWNFWMPRIIRLSNWVVSNEQKWRKTARFGASEIDGAITFTEGLKRDFVLTARADRIDIKHDNSAAIIDYKSGGTYSKSRMESGDLPQLPLEALILTENSFDKLNIKENTVSSISYWKMTGGGTEGEVIELHDEQKLQNTIAAAKQGLSNILQIFEDNQTPYIAIPRLDNAPRFNDYEHLERVKEWAALGDNNEEAA